MALQGVLRKDPATGMHLADRVRARKAIIRWLRSVTEAGATPIPLAKLAKEEGISFRRLTKILQEDERLQESVFGGMEQRAQLALMTAVSRGETYLHEEHVDPKEARQWAEFFARFIGGQFRARQGPSVVVLANLIPELPPAARHIQARVLEAPEAPGTTLQKLLGPGEQEETEDA